MSVQPPSNVNFSPDGAFVTFLDCPFGSKVKELFAVNLATKEVTSIVKPQNDGNTEQTLSFEEKMRRERLRDLSIGVTDYSWSPNPALPYILIPQQGNLYLQDGVGGALRLLVDKSLSGRSGPAVYATFSPNGENVAFVQDGEVYVVSTQDPAAVPRQVTFGAREAGKTNGVANYIAQEEMARGEGFWWSPDSTHIAFEECDESHIPHYRIMHQGKDEVGCDAQEDHRYPFAGASNPRVRLGVVNVTEDASVGKWMDLGPDPEVYMGRAGWLTPGVLVLQLQNRLQTITDVVAVDVRTGRRRLLFRELSDSWINLHNMFTVLSPTTLAEPATHSDTVSFLWASERSGFQHLYLYQVVTSTLFADETKLAIGDVGESAVDGAATLVRQLTGGNYHIFDIIRVDEKHGWVYFDANVGSPLYHQLCRVNLRDPTAPFAIHHQSDAENIAFLPSVAEVPDWHWAGDSDKKDLETFGVQRVTFASGYHTAVVHPTSEYFVDLFSNVSTRHSMTLYRLAPVEGQSAVGFTPDSPAAVMQLYPRSLGSGEPEETKDEPHRIAPQLVAFPTTDRKEVLFGAYLKPDPVVFGPGPYKTVISVYGGPNVQRVVDAFTLLQDTVSQQLCKAGYVVFVTDNRGSHHRGTRFEAAVKHSLGSLEVDDQVAGVLVLESLGLASPASGVGIFGWSYGGYMTLMCLAKRPDVFTVGASGAPVSNWDGYDTHYTERYMSTPQANPEGYKESSVMAHAHKISGKLLLIHGLIDENVHFRHTARLINALLTHRVHHDLLLLPDERHSVRTHRAYLDQRIIDHFKAHVKV